MNALGPWTNEDYEALSWHDVHVYGFRLDSFDKRNGTADLILDIDYILRWELKGLKGRSIYSPYVRQRFASIRFLISSFLLII